MKKAFCFDNCAGYFLRKKFVHVWFEISSVTSVDKREPRGTFLSLGLFISRPRPTALASKMRPRLQKTFPRYPFFYFGNFGQISNQTWTNFSSVVVSTKIETKYYFFLFCSTSEMAITWKFARPPLHNQKWCLELRSFNVGIGNLRQHAISWSSAWKASTLAYYGL